VGILGRRNALAAAVFAPLNGGRDGSPLAPRSGFDHVKTVKILGQPSWRLKTDRVLAFVTRLGGMIAPVTYRLKGRKVSPYSVVPWAEEKLPASVPALVRAARGDFFCLPFGFNARRYRGEAHPIHGECTHGPWRFRNLRRVDGRLSLRLTFATRIRPGLITKEVTLVPGQTAVYQRHLVSGMRGPMSYGHHAMLKFPPEEGSGRIAVSPFLFGQVWPGPHEDPALGGYSCLRQSARFTSLHRVPLENGGTTDLSLYPARAGFEDGVTLATDPRLPLGWTTVTFPRQRFVWFSLKNPRELGQTLFWFSNGGRHYPPWNGRHRNVMGLEEITSMVNGLPASVAANPFSRAGSPTHQQMDPRHPTLVRSVHGVASIPAGFDVVASVRPAPGGIELVSKSGRVARARVDLSFLA
jgi:hypothetical protein